MLTEYFWFSLVFLFALITAIQGKKAIMTWLVIGNTGLMIAWTIFAGAKLIEIHNDIRLQIIARELGRNGFWYYILNFVPVVLAALALWLAVSVASMYVFGETAKRLAKRFELEDPYEDLK